MVDRSTSSISPAFSNNAASVFCFTSMRRELRGENYVAVKVIPFDLPYDAMAMYKCSSMSIIVR
ncbi:hypothetical protein RSAG8_05172, partial [Rhizoctonia solani AG-8 WAC10335]